MKFLKKFLSIIKSLFLILIFTFLISLSIDFLFGKKLLQITDKYWLNTEFYGRIKRIDHPTYHHGLKENVVMKTAKGFNGNFTFCTDNHGFKYKCRVERGKKFDIGFIGDSFTEGVSLPYEKTFVGIFENDTDKTIANLGVISYSPKIYLSKLNYYLNQGYKFNHIIVFIDISDLYDDSVYYRINEQLVVSENYERGKRLKIRKFLRKHFPFTNFYMYVIKNLNRSPELKVSQNFDNPVFNDKVQIKAKWTYSKENKIDGYWGTIESNQKELLKNMTKLYELLQKNNINMSLAIYPWPQQLEKDTVNSKHVRMWKKFCIKRCDNFINFFPILFGEKDKEGFLNTYKKYYYWNDIHFNENGNKLIAKELVKILN